MSLTASELSCADIAAVVGANKNDGGFGFGNGEGWWVILLFLLLGNNGWGNGFGGGNGGAGGLYPWMNQTDTINGGFRDQMINNNITSIRDGIGNLSTQLCNCCCDMRDTVNQGFYNSEIAAANRQMANMNQAFGLQNAINSGFNATQAQLAQCCCDNRLATANLGADIAREACATRTSDTQNTQILLNAINDGFRQMSDQRYQDKIDAKNDEIAQLRQENLYARGQASQIAQDQRIINGVYNRLNECPVGTVPVYGEQAIFSCPNNQNQGCGCNGNFYN